MKRMIWAALMTTVLTAPAFAQDKPASTGNNTSATTTTSNTTVDIKADKQKVHQDRTALKADRAAGNTSAAQNDKMQLKKDRAALSADQSLAGVTPKHHKKNAHNVQSGSASHSATTPNNAPTSK